MKNKKNYALIVGVLLLLIVGGYFVVREYLKNDENLVQININNEHTKIENHTKESDSMHPSFRLEFITSKNEAINSLKHDKIIISEMDKGVIGEINLINENPFSDENNKPFFKNTNSQIEEIHYVIDTNIENSNIISNYIAISFVAKSEEYKKSSSSTVVFNKNGEKIFETGINFDSNVTHLSVSPNLKYLSVLSQPYLSKNEDYLLKKKQLFYNLDEKKIIVLDNQYNNYWNSTGWFNEYNYFFHAGKKTVFIDFNTRNLFISNKFYGKKIKVNDLSNFYYLDNGSNININNDFTKITF